MPIASCVVQMLLLSPSLLGLDAPATRPAMAEGPVGWLDLCVREAGEISDPLLQAQAYSKAGVLKARLGDVPGYHRVMDLAQEALRRAKSQPGNSPVTEAEEIAIGPLLEAMAQRGDVAGARALADQRSKDNKSFRLGYSADIAAGQAKAGDVEGALAIAKAFDEYDRQIVLREVVSALAATNRFSQARHIADLMTSDSTERRDAIRAIDRGLARTGNYSAALALADLLPYASDKQSVYQDVVHYQAAHGDYAAARATAARVPLGEKLISPNTPPEYGRSVAYADIEQIQLDRKDIVGAKETAALVEGDLKASVLEQIAMAEIAAGDLTSARKTADSIPSVTANLMGDTPSIRVYEALAVALAKKGDIAGAIKVARALPAAPRTLLNIAQIAAESGKREEARRILDELKAEPVSPLVGGVSSFQLASVEKLLGDSDDFDREVADLKRRAALPGDVEARVELFTLYVARGDINGARSIAPGLPANLRGFLIATVASQADSARARELADLMPTAQERAAVLQQALGGPENLQAASERIRDQISHLPTPYDRSLAYLSRAEYAWRESLRDGR